MSDVTQAVVPTPHIFLVGKVIIMLKILTAAALLLAAGVLNQSQAHAGLILNGGFEQPEITGGYQTFSAGSSGIPGWEILGNSVDIIGNSTNAYDGDQFLDIDGTPGPGGIQQTFATSVGSQYTLSFAYRRTGTAADVTVFDDLGTVLDFTVNGTSSWTTYSVAFFARETATKLRFFSTSTFSNDGLYIDAVEVEPGQAAVPEPTSFALLGLGGIGFLGGAWRKQRKARA